MGTMNAALKLSPAVFLTGTGTPVEWTPGPWVEMIASTGTAIQLAGLAGVPASCYLVDIGVGAAGSEVAIASVRSVFPENVGYAGDYVFWFPAPIAKIPQGSRVVGRVYWVKAAGAASARWQSSYFHLQYYEDADTDLSTTLNASCVPYQEHGKTLTTNAVAWENSDWCEVTPGFDDRNIGLYALTAFPEPNTGTRHEEWDIAFGAEGEEVLATTLRGYRRAFNGERGHMPLPAIYPVPSGTRIAVRTRTSEGAARIYREICLDFYDLAAPEPPEPPVEPPSVVEPAILLDCFCDYNPAVIPGTGDGLNPDEPVVELFCDYNPPIVPGTGDGL